MTERVFPLAAFMLAAVLAQGPVPASKGVNFYSLAREISLGRELAAELERSLPMIRNDRLRAYLEDLGSDLAKHTGEAALPYSFTTMASTNP